MLFHERTQGLQISNVSVSFQDPDSVLLIIFDAQSLSHVQLFVTLWTIAQQASLSFTISQRLLKFKSVVSMIPPSYLILCRPLLLLSIFPSIRVFSTESALCIRWPQYQSFGISPSSEHSGLISFRIGWLISLPSKGLSRVFFSATVQKHQFFDAQSSLWSNSHIHT